MADRAGARCTVRIEADDDGAAVRAAVRRLLAAGVEPAHVDWHVGTAADLWSCDSAAPTPPTAAADAREATPADSIRLPAFFAPLFDHAVLHADRGRHALLYRLAWRLLHEPGLRHDPLDADRALVERRARAVSRDMHKMTAFVRFRPLPPPPGAAPGETPWQVAWFEPEHHVVRSVAPWFARRYGRMRWAILTPRCSVRWDGEQLAVGPGARRDEAPAADAAERLWLVYYEHIFNPARLNLESLQRHMPRRYWNDLPEAALIHPLAARADERSAGMVDAGGTGPARRRPHASVALRRPGGDGVTLVAPTGKADGVGDLDTLRAATERCRACPIGQHATQAVTGEGPLQPRLMLVGEQPGDQEDLRGRPFLGPAGKVLDRALAQLGWPRDQLYLTNAVRHFKFELRRQRRIHKTPAQQEAAACLDWLEREIALVQPKAIVALGATAARSLMGRPVPVTAERGHWLARADGRRVLLTLHPSALLRLPRDDFELAFETWLRDLQHAADVA